MRRVFERFVSRVTKSLDVGKQQKRKIELPLPTRPEWFPWRSHSSQSVISWRELLAIGDSVADAALDAVEEEQFVNDACMLVYTSGESGICTLGRIQTLTASISKSDVVNKSLNIKRERGTKQNQVLVR